MSTQTIPRALGVSTPDIQMAEQFLFMLDPAASFFTFQTFDDSKAKRPTLAKIRHGTLAAHISALCDANKAGAGIFVTINQTDGKGREIGNMIRARAVWCDWDHADRDPPEWPLEPSATVATSPGKFQFLWLLDYGETMTPNQHRHVIDSIVSMGGDAGAKGYNRVLRVPGFYHMKNPANPYMAELREISGNRYAVDELLAAFPPVVAKVQNVHNPLLDSKPEHLRGATGLVIGPAYAPITRDDVAAMLKHVPLDESYGGWLNIGMALHSWDEDAGLELWHEWSRQYGDKYNEQEINEKWRTFKAKPDGVTMATIARIARDNGYTGTILHAQAAQGAQAAYALQGDSDTMQQSVKIPHGALDRRSDGGVIKSLRSFEAVMRANGINIRYNVLKKVVEISVPGVATLPDDRLNVLQSHIVSACALARMPAGEYQGYTNTVAHKNVFNPAAVWITSTPWDGVDRLTELSATITTSAPDALKDLYLRKWMTGAVAAAFEPDGVAGAGVLVFQGEQGSGKTQWFKSLVGDERELTADGVALRVDNRDSVFQCLTNWLVELGELDATFKKSDIASLKAFLGKHLDVLRKSHVQHDSHFPRRTVFMASVNQPEFLHDDTGNRRFWVLGGVRLNWRHGIDMQQVWAQVHQQLYLGDFGWHMDAAQTETVNAGNIEFTANKPESHPWAEPIAAYLDLLVTNGRCPQGVSIGDILIFGVDVQTDRQTRAMEMQVSKIVRAAGWEKRLFGPRRLSRWFPPCAAAWQQEGITEP